VGTEIIESSFTEKELRSQVDKNLIWRKHIDLVEMKTNCILMDVSKTIDRRSREAIFFLPCTCDTICSVLCTLLLPSARKLFTYWSDSSGPPA